MKTYQRIALALAAMENCQKSGNVEWHERHKATIEQIVENNFPSGSGFDSGTQFDFDASNQERLVFNTSFHHMDGNGYYDGWTEHTVTVKPSLAFGTMLKISGRNRNEIKDEISEMFDIALNAEVE